MTRQKKKISNLSRQTTGIRETSLLRAIGKHEFMAKNLHLVYFSFHQLIPIPRKAPVSSIFSLSLTEIGQTTWQST